MKPETDKTAAESMKMARPDGVDWLESIGAISHTPLQQAGLVDTSYSSGSVMLRELSGIALLRIHSLQPFAALRDNMAACNIQLPSQVNQSLGKDPAALCVAPGEWLVFSEFLGSNRLFEHVHESVDIHHTAVLDLSDGMSVFRLSGSGAPWLLSKLCGLDFHDGASATAHGARTRLQQLAVTLHYHRPGGLSGDSVYDLIFDRSVALYLWQLLIASIPHAEELQQQYGDQS